MRLILLGAPGAGKGTIAKLLTDIDGSVQISTGDILRAAVKEGSTLGQEAEAFMKAGELVPDRLIMDMVEARLQAADCHAGFLLDGFPRTMPQAEALKTLLEKLAIQLDVVVNLMVPRAVILERLTTRRTCMQCGAIYNTKSNPSKVAGVCDICSGKLIQRDDETEEAISRRLDVFSEQTAPLVDYYQHQDNWLAVDGTSSDTVIQAITSHINR